MRVLSRKQKRIIDDWFEENWTGAGSIREVEDMPIKTYELLETINDHETIYQNINRYIQDKIAEKVYG